MGHVLQGQDGAHRPGHVSSGVPRSFACRWQMYAVTIARLVNVVNVNLRSTTGAAVGHLPIRAAAPATTDMCCSGSRKQLNAWHGIGAHAYAAPAVPHRRWYMKNHRYSGVSTVDTMPATCRQPGDQQHTVMKLQWTASQLSTDCMRQLCHTKKQVLA